MVASSISTELEGLVSRTNGHGFQVAGREGWLNFSKFATPAPEMPPEGARVRVGLDKGGFVREVAVVEPARRAETPGSAAVLAELVDRDRRILRQAVLNSAITVLATNGSVDADEALELAAKFERWVLR
jgi:hypothetical protein